ncbi:MAG: alpha/beta hydrolase [Bacteroidota bacterium]
MKLLLNIFKWIGIVLLSISTLFTVLVFLPAKEIVPSIQPRANTEYWAMSENFNIAYHHLERVDTIHKTPVVYLHGGPGGYIHSSIIETLEVLTPLGHDVYLYDQRGSGLSDRMPNYTDIKIEKHLQDLYEIITEHIQTEKVILIGQSFGSILVAHFAARHPKLVEKMVFSAPGQLEPYQIKDGYFVRLDSLYPTPDTLQFIEPYDFQQDVARISMRPKAIAATFGALLFDAKWVSDKQMDRMLNGLASQFTKGMVCDPANVLPEEGGGGLYAFLAGNNDDFPEARPAMRTVQAPALVLQGQCEYHSYYHGYEYVDVFPNGQYQFIDGAGHEIWWEQQEAYQEAIVTFLNGD